MKRKNSVMTQSAQNKFLKLYAGLYNQSKVCILMGLSRSTLESFKRANPKFVIKLAEADADLVGMAVDVYKKALLKGNLYVAEKILKSKMNKDSDLAEIIEDTTVQVDLTQLKLHLADVKSPVRQDEYVEGDKNL